MIKVRNGTARHDGESLCKSCRHATIIRGERIDEEIIRCGELSGNASAIRFKVVECSSHQSKAESTLNMMREIAWEVRTDKTGKKIGFMSPLDARQKKDDLIPLTYVTDPFTGDDY